MAWPSGCVVLRVAGSWQWTWNGAQLSRELSVNQSIALTLAHPSISQLYNSAHLWHVWQFRTQKIVTKQLCRHKVSWRSAFLLLWTATIKWLQSYLLTKLQLFNCYTDPGVDCHMLNSSSAAVDPSKIQISTIWNKEFFMRWPESVSWIN